MEKCGLDALGVTHGGALVKERAYLEKRRALYGLCPFEGADLEERLDPGKIYPGTRTVLVFAINTRTEDPALKPGQGLLASISRTLDYHRVLKEAGGKLKEVLALEEEAPILVDSHPLMERAFAQRAGLGYVGKNCQLIHRVYGTYLALGLLLTREEFPPDDPNLEEGCGTCQACLRACPGKALKGKGEMDPFSCLSYLSQAKERTEEEEKKLAYRLYGCDLCQKVCPKNQQVPLSRGKVLVEGGLYREDIASLSNRDFKRTFGQLAGAWRGKKQWMRNFDYIEDYWKTNREP